MWLASVAWAEDPVPEPAPPSEPAVEPAPAEPAVAAPTEPYEVVVYGEIRVQQAHDALIQQLDDMGYDSEVIDRGDHVVYRHSEPWKGEVVVYDDGWMQVKRQPMRVEGAGLPFARRNSPLAWVGCVIWPWACLRLGGASVGERKWRQIEDFDAELLDPRLRTWGNRIADLATQNTVDALPDRLNALWVEGRPLGRGPALVTAAERRAALYEYWATRTDTEWGDAVRDAVEAFCRAVVQTSDQPFEPSELAGLAAAHPEAPAFLAPKPVEDDP